MNKIAHWLFRSRQNFRKSSKGRWSGVSLGVRGVVFDAENQVFLIRHTYVPGWYLPGGAVKPGESAVMALARELEEEGNLLLSGAPQLHGLFYDARGHGHVACYIVRDFRQSAPHKGDLEIAESGFFPIDQLPASTSRATRARLDEVLQGTPIPQVW